MRIRVKSVFTAREYNHIVQDKASVHCKQPGVMVVMIFAKSVVARCHCVSG
jgi:hypothetical protein